MLQLWVAMLVARLANKIAKTLPIKGNNKMNIIPAFLRKKDPDRYYKTVRKHTKWLENT